MGYRRTGGPWASTGSVSRVMPSLAIRQENDERNHDEIIWGRRRFEIDRRYYHFGSYRHNGARSGGGDFSQEVRLTPNWDWEKSIEPRGQRFGTPFTKQGQATKGNYNASDATVIKDGSTYRMYHTDNIIRTGFTIHTSLVQCTATSLAGPWTYNPAQVFDDGLGVPTIGVALNPRAGNFDQNLEAPTVVEDTGGTIRMLYQGYEDGAGDPDHSSVSGFPTHIYLATSSDGVTFTRFNGAGPDGSVLPANLADPNSYDHSGWSSFDVTYNETDTQLYGYAAATAYPTSGGTFAGINIALARSSNNGQTWTKDSDNPIYAPWRDTALFPEWASEGIAEPNLVLGPDGVWWMFCTGMKYDDTYHSMVMARSDGDEEGPWRIWNNPLFYKDPPPAFDDRIIVGTAVFIENDVVHFWYSAYGTAGVWNDDNADRVTLGYATAPYDSLHAMFGGSNATPGTVIESADGTAAGVATAAATGRAVKPAASTVAGVATAVATGRATIARSGTAAGIATAAATGRSTYAAQHALVGVTPFGVSTAGAVGRSTSETAGTSAGVATAVGAGEFSSVAFTDSFNRADAFFEDSLVASSGGVWEHDGLIADAMGIVGNELINLTTNSTGTAFKAPDQGTADHYVQFEVRNVSAESGPFVCNRLADRSNFVGIRNNGGDIEIYRRVSGTLSNLYSADENIVLGDILRLECEGTNWRAFKNGVEFASGAIGSAGLTSQRQGVVGRTTVQNPWINNFEAGALGVVSGDATGIAHGIATTSAVGVLLRDFVGTVAGIAATTATGRSTAGAAGTSSALATVTAAAQFALATTGTIAGASTAAAVGGSTHEAEGHASTIGIGSAIGRAFAAGASTVAGTSTAAATGANAPVTQARAGTSAGVATAAATGRATSAMAGTAAGVAVGSATSIATSVAVGTSAGVATSQGSSTSETTISSVGTSVGVATATAPGRAITSTFGTAAAGALTEATGARLFDAVGTATAAALVAANGGGIAAAVGSALLQTLVEGVGSSEHAAVGLSQGFGVVVSFGDSGGSSVGTTAGTSTALASGAGIVITTTAPGRIAVLEAEDRDIEVGLENRIAVTVEENRIIAA